MNKPPLSPRPSPLAGHCKTDWVTTTVKMPRTRKEVLFWAFKVCRTSFSQVVKSYLDDIGPEYIAKAEAKVRKLQKLKG